MLFKIILEIPQRAWDKKYKGQDKEYTYIPDISYETGSNKVNW